MYYRSFDQQDGQQDTLDKLTLLLPTCQRNSRKFHNFAMTDMSVGLLLLKVSFRVAVSITFLCRVRHIGNLCLLQVGNTGNTTSYRALTLILGLMFFCTYCLQCTVQQLRVAIAAVSKHCKLKSFFVQLCTHSRVIVFVPVWHPTFQCGCLQLPKTQLWQSMKY